MSSISDELDRDYAPAWRPERGDKLVGVVTDLSEREGYGGVMYPIVTVRQADGVELAFHAFHEVAQTELAKLRPKVGDEIGIKYLGKVKPEGGGSSYHGYRLRKSGGSSAGVNWSRYGDGDEPEPQPDLPVDAVEVAEAAAAGDDDSIPF
jgi:hypothetical protein